MNEKLEACPFCGGEAKLLDLKLYAPHFYVVRCITDSCCMRQGHVVEFLSKEKAVKAWNCRADKQE